MSFEKFFTAFKDYLNSKGTCDSGDFPIKQYKEEMRIALNDIIDERIKLDKHKPPRKSSMTTVMPSQRPMESDSVDMLDALNCAPIPPANPSNYSQWMEAYTKWYYSKRNKVIKR